MERKKKVVIMGAAGRDFHNFNVHFRDNEGAHVVAFTASQIPDIDDKTYPASLAGPLYPDGIPIVAEAELTALIQAHDVDEVIFAYSDISHESVMHKASLAMAAGCDFRLMGPKSTCVASSKPLISICATRTGCGKSQTTRYVAQLLQEAGHKVVAIRHPMPYGDLAKQKVQRFATLEDLKTHHCTIEEMEEYEPYIAMGSVIYAGVDYEAILRQAEAEADVIIWDGGNNDFSFYQADVHIVVADPHRAGHELRYHPGELNLRQADVVVINKIDTADYRDIIKLRQNVLKTTPDAVIVEAASAIFVEGWESIRDRRVLVIEDGPTLTHGQMKYGAGTMAAERYGASEIVDPRPYLQGKLKETFAAYPEIGHVLPAMGYGEEQMRDLAATIQATDCDLVVIGTPIDLSRVIDIDKPSVRVQYELDVIGTPDLKSELFRRLSLTP